MSKQLEPSEAPILTHGAHAPLCTDVERWFEGISQWRLTSWLLLMRHRHQTILVPKMSPDGFYNFEAIDAPVVSKHLGLPNGVVSEGQFSGWVVKPFFADSREKGWMLGRPLDLNLSYEFLHLRGIRITEHEQRRNDQSWKMVFMKWRKIMRTQQDRSLPTIIQAQMAHFTLDEASGLP